MHTNFGNNFLVEYFAYVRRGGQYEKIYHAPRRQLCDFFADDKLFYPDLARSSDFPEDIRKHCPLDKVRKCIILKNGNGKIIRIIS